MYLWVNLYYGWYYMDNNNETPVKLDNDMVDDETYTDNNTEPSNSFTGDMVYSSNYQGYPETAVASNNRSENVITGTIGALLGSLIGVAVWVLISKAGYIAGIAGLVMAFCSLFGYMKLGGGLSKKGGIICIAIIIGMVYFATRLSWTLEIYDALREIDPEISFVKIFGKLPELLKLTNSKFDFYKDLAIGYVLTLISSGATLFKAIR